MRTFKIFDDRGSHEYDLFVNQTNKGTKYSIHYSMNEAWTNPGSPILEILDDGDEYIVSEKIGKSIDYALFVELKLLFSIISKIDVENRSQGKYQILEVKDSLEV